ncbi:MAG: lysophospholipid acyltransferase family protein [Candidatus Sulfotelmatobacter sp.]
MTDRGKAEEMFLAPAAGSVVFQAFCRLFFLSYAPLRVEGRNHLPASPFILCSNHTSHIDSAVLMAASGRLFSDFALLGASDYFFDSRRVRFVVSRFMNVIPIDRQAQPKALRRSLAMCNDFLQRRQGNLILYPEGTRSYSGEIQTFKRGAGLFAVELGVPVVPAYIEGARNILAKGKIMPRLGAVTVRFGQPIMFESNPFDPLLRRQIRKTAVELLEQRICGLRRRPDAGELAGLAGAGRRTAITISAVATAGRNPSQSHAQPNIAVGKLEQDQLGRDQRR